MLADAVGLYLLPCVRTNPGAGHHEFHLLCPCAIQHEAVCVYAIARRSPQEQTALLRPEHNK
eukprot:16437708-Heterocapsa_arctica.AAC.1